MGAGDSVYAGMYGGNDGVDGNLYYGIFIYLLSLDVEL